VRFEKSGLGGFFEVIGGGKCADEALQLVAGDQPPDLCGAVSEFSY
jgi:hypothetical protein